MPQNFIGADRDQLMLMPVDVREWLSEDDVAWQVLDVVDQLDLSGFYRRYRANGQGAAAFDPALMLSLVIYAHAVGVRSSRAIERACTRDAGFKVVAGQRVPDHSTITRFLQRHREEVADVFGQVLRLCHAAGMARVGVIAVDGTKIAANASWAKSYTAKALAHQVAEQEAAYRQLAAELLDQHAATDAAEDAEHGERRGDEPPAALRGRAARLKALRAAQADLQARQDRVRQEMLQRQKARQDAYDARAAAGERGLGPRPADEVKVGQPPSRQGGPPRASVTDPDSRRMKAKHGFVQGYNAQIAVTDTQVICGLLVTQTATDHHLLPQVLTATRQALSDAGIDDPLRIVLADAGYANEDTFTAAERDGLALLAPVISDERRGLGADPLGGKDVSRLPATARAQERLRSPDGEHHYAMRGRTVEPVFGQLKDRLGMRQFTRRGLTAVNAEFALAATVHNIRKLITWNAATLTA